MRFPALSLALTFFVSTLLAQTDPIHTSMIELLSNPEKFHGKFVQVSGYLHNKFEDSTLYLSKEDADYLNGRQGIWLVWGDKMKTEPNKPGEYFDCKHVLVEGIFDKTIGGHMGLTSPAGIRDISRISEDPRIFDGKKRLKD